MIWVPTMRQVKLWWILSSFTIEEQNKFDVMSSEPEISHVTRYFIKYWRQKIIGNKCWFKSLEKPVGGIETDSKPEEP